MFATKAENLDVRLGDKTSLICRGIGWPTPKLRWILNGVTVGQNYKEVRVTDVENICPDLFETAQMLRISKVTSNLGGTLKVVAINELGSDLQELLVSSERAINRLRFISVWLNVLLQSCSERRIVVSCCSEVIFYFKKRG